MEVSYYSNGKLLLSGEYGVLDGALALAIPTQYGQSLKIKSSNTPTLHWESLDPKGTVWFSAEFDTNSLTTLSSSDKALAKPLEQLLMQAKALNSDFYLPSSGVQAISQLSFPRNWGLGSSSTLINNIAQWAKVDPYVLLQATFGGSGYDIACAQYNSPILYQLKQDSPFVKEVHFDPSFKDQLYFVYLNQKQNSRTAIANYRKQNFEKKAVINALTEVTQNLLNAESLVEFERLLEDHEFTLSKVLQIAPVKELLFPDYFGTVKSLGGWGGDFVLATGNEKTPGYFKTKGFDTVIPYQEMVL